MNPEYRRSLYSAAYVGCQRDTARICGCKVQRYFLQKVRRTAAPLLLSAGASRAANDRYLLSGWRRGIVVSGVRRMNEVNARRARLVPGWVTVYGRVYHLGM